MNTSIAVCGVNPLDVNTPCCPVCGKSGKKVKPETIKGMVKEEYLPTVTEGYFLCLSKDCKVIYFGKQVFYKPDVKVKVWFKEENDSSVPICYCKDVTKEAIIDHVAVRRCCENIKDIHEHTRANTGKECLTKNPAGT